MPNSHGVNEECGASRAVERRRPQVVAQMFSVVRLCRAAAQRVPAAQLRPAVRPRLRGLLPAARPLSTDDGAGGAGGEATQQSAAAMMTLEDLFAPTPKHVVPEKRCVRAWTLVRARYRSAIVSPVPDEV